MPTAPLRSALRAALATGNLHFLFRTDADLLAAFAAERDEAAFAELVRRHVRLVRGTARRVIGIADAAEDVFQATFLLLARKAAGGSWGPTVGPWLYQATLRLAAKARSRAARRPIASPMSPNIPAPPIDPSAGLAWAEVRAALDRGLGALPARLRDPLVLCYLEGMTRDEAATALGCSSAAIKGRVARGRERLRELFANRGLALSAALAAPLVAEPAIRGGEAAATAKAAAAFLTTGVAPPAVRALLPVMLGWKLTAGMVGVVLACAAGAVGVGRALPTGEPPPAAAKADAPAPAQPPAAARTMRVIVLDPQGRPLAEAKVHSSIWTEEKGFKHNHDYQTDAAGAALVELPNSFYILRLLASKKPFTEMLSHWEERDLANGQTVPAEYTIRLVATVTAGGRVLDEQGRPLAGAKVVVNLMGNQRPAGGDSRTDYVTGLAFGDTAVTTGADGRWHIDNLPDDPQADVTVIASHPDFVTEVVARYATEASGITTANLREQAATLKLKRGVVVTGRVTDPAGNPVRDAVVAFGETNSWNWVSADAGGRFRLPSQTPKVMSFVVIAPGWAPQLRRTTLRADFPPQEFRLEPGKPIRVKIVDAAGKPVRRAAIRPSWRGNQGLETVVHGSRAKTGIPTQSDDTGVWEWPSAPADTVSLRIDGAGFARCHVDLTGGDPERRVVLKAEHRVTGRVTDALTGQPIPVFTLIPVDVFRPTFLFAERNNAKPGKGGRLNYLANRTDIPQRLRVEAAGYRTQTGPEFRIGDDAARVQDFPLQPSPPVIGTVLDADGRPAAGAEVFLGTPTEPADLKPFHDLYGHKTAPDAAGRFRFPDPGEPFAVVVRSDAGFAQAEFPVDHHDAGTLHLRPWAAIHGRFQDGGWSVAGASVYVRTIDLRGPDRPQVDTTLHVVTGPGGQFDFPRVPPGPVSVQVFLGPWKDEGFRSGPSVPLDLKPGQKVELDLGSGGATVTGRVKLIGKVPADLDCNYSINCLVRREPGVTPPPEIAALGFDARGGWRDAWRMSQEGLAFLNTLRSWFVKLAPDGSFRIRGVPAGEYDLAVAVYAKPSGCLVDPLARQVVRVTVTADDVARGELKLPEIAAAVVPVPMVGDVPTLTFRRADGTADNLAEFRGKTVLVHFWASWCGPCKQQLPAVRRLHEQFAGRGLVTLGLSVDDDAAAWHDAVKRLALPWSQGRAAVGEAGVSGVPMYWLLGPDGKLVAKNFDTDEIAKALGERLK